MISHAIWLSSETHKLRNALRDLAPPMENPQFPHESLPPPGKINLRRFISPTKMPMEVTKAMQYWLVVSAARAMHLRRDSLRIAEILSESQRFSQNRRDSHRIVFVAFFFCFQEKGFYVNRDYLHWLLCKLLYSYNSKSCVRLQDPVDDDIVSTPKGNKGSGSSKRSASGSGQRRTSGDQKRRKGRHAQAVTDDDVSMHDRDRNAWRQQRPSRSLICCSLFALLGVLQLCDLTVGGSSVPESTATATGALGYADESEELQLLNDPTGKASSAESKVKTQLFGRPRGQAQSRVAASSATDSRASAAQEQSHSSSSVTNRAVAALKFASDQRAAAAKRAAHKPAADNDDDDDENDPAWIPEPAAAKLPTPPSSAKKKSTGAPAASSRGGAKSTLPSKAQQRADKAARQHRQADVVDAEDVDEEDADGGAALDNEGDVNMADATTPRSPEHRPSTSSRARHDIVDVDMLDVDAEPTSPPRRPVTPLASATSTPTRGTGRIRTSPMRYGVLTEQEQKDNVRKAKEVSASERTLRVHLRVHSCHSLSRCIRLVVWARPRRTRRIRRDPGRGRYVAKTRTRRTRATPASLIRMKTRRRTTRRRRRRSRREWIASTTFRPLRLQLLRATSWARWARRARRSRPDSSARRAATNPHRLLLHRTTRRGRRRRRRRRRAHRARRRDRRRRPRRTCETERHHAHRRIRRRSSSK